LVALKLIGSQRVAELRQLLGALEPWDKEWSRIAPDLRSTRQAAEKPGAPRLTVGGNETARVLEFLDWNHAWFRAFEQRLGALVKAVEQDRRATAGMVDHLLAEAKKMLMLPFSTLFLVLPKLVRDLCRDQGKQADLVLRGSEVEIDKRVLEEMKDPLIHLVRNCIDHGFEKPDQRAAQNKPPRAQLRVTVAQVDSNKVEIVIADDGRGIDAASVKRAAVRQGLLSEDAARQLDDAASLDLIFRSGVSTSPLLTELSGRGLGLAIVREKVERLGGQVFVETQAGAGTTFRVLLPLTLATFRGILVRAAEQTFVIPSAQLERVIRVRPGEMRTVDNQQTVALDGRAVALVPLADVLELPPPRGCRIGPISRRPLSWALVTSGWLSPWPKCCKSRRCLSKVSARRYLACATWPARRSWGPAGPWPS
jgi:two-component system chemotaxis sensor kinase CheA